MHLCAITDEISQDFEHALDVLLEYGANAAELRGLWGVNIAEIDDAQADRAAAALKTRGMRAAALATPFYKCDLDEAGGEGSGGRMHLASSTGRAKQLDLLKRCSELAHRFDTKLLRVFTFWRRELLTPELERRIADAFAAPVEIARQEGLTLGLENEHACYIGTGAEAARVAAQVNSPQLRIVWDPGNAFYAGEAPYPLGYEAVRPWIAHVHAKDACMVETPDQGLQPYWRAIGSGEIDWRGQIRALRDDGYRGDVSVETHYTPEHGTGLGGKGTPEDGSRACLAALRTLISA